MVTLLPQRNVLRLSLAALGGIIVASYLVFSYWLGKQLEVEAIEFKENLVWAVFQSEKELILTLRDAENAKHGMDVSRDTLQLRYDIFVSRLNLIDSGQGFSDLMKIGGFPETLASIQESVDFIDRHSENFKKPEEFAQLLIDNLSRFEAPLQSLSLDAVHFATANNTRKNEDIREKLNWLQALFLINVAIIVGALFVAFRQTLRAYQSEFRANAEMRERRFLEETSELSKLQALGSLAGGVAHEINTPAQFVSDNLIFIREVFDRLMADRLAEGRSDDSGEISAEDWEYYREEVPMALSEAKEGMERIAEIVSAIKHFAHPSEGARVLVDVNEEVKAAIVLTRNQTKLAADVEERLTELAPAIEGKPNDLNQVLINLILNAAQAIEDAAEKGAMKDKGLIIVSTGLTLNKVTIRVTDNGPGVPPNILPRIFDPFFTTKPVGVGSGQGLPLSRRIITTTFGGTLRVDESYKDGCSMVIEIPVPSGSVS